MADCRRSTIRFTYRSRPSSHGSHPWKSTRVRTYSSQTEIPAEIADGGIAPAHPACGSILAEILTRKILGDDLRHLKFDRLKMCLAIIAIAILRRESERAVLGGMTFLIPTVGARNVATGSRLGSRSSRSIFFTSHRAYSVLMRTQNHQPRGIESQIRALRHRKDMILWPVLRRWLVDLTPLERNYREWDSIHIHIFFGQQPSLGIRRVVDTTEPPTNHLLARATGW